MCAEIECVLRNCFTPRFFYYLSAFEETFKLRHVAFKSLLIFSLFDLLIPEKVMLKSLL